MHCPGHFGHIQLPVPVYNPLVFSTVLRLLRAACLHCGGFRMSEQRTAAHARKLRLLARGELAAAQRVRVTVGGKKARRGGSAEDGEEAEEELQACSEDEDDGGGNSSLPGPVCAPAWTTHSWGEARTLLTAFLAKQPAACERCGCRSPALAAEAPSKILRKPLGAKARARNAGLGCDVERELGGLWARLCAGADDSDVAALFGADAPLVTDEASEGEEADEEEEEEQEEEEEANDQPDRAPQQPKASDDDAMQVDAPLHASAARAQPEGAPPPGSARTVLLTPTEARALLRRLWRSDGDWVSLAYASDAGVAAEAVARAPPRLGDAGGTTWVSDPACLFLQTLLVPPNKLRPPSRLGEMTFEHPQNEQYKSILVASTRLTDLMRGEAARPPPGSLNPAAAAAAAARADAYALEISTPRGRAERAVRLWLEMQAGVNRLVGVAGAGSKEAPLGIKQQLERKQGLFRMNMMGKRVNYAARSVISPDPFLAPGEVGVPPFIAQKLTFTELVTPHNVAKLRQAVMNGPEVYPGATAVENESGRVVLLAHLSAQKRAALGKTLLTGAAAAGGPGGPGSPRRSAAGGAAKAVYRHLVDGDVLLTNRQPTLHKPGLMAHRARVLKGQRTIRLHYSNCATFNADFDGDEINLHMPQEQHGRAEAYGIVAADQQFCVPTDGKPVRGLIQDHVVSGVLLLKRGTFLTASQFSNLLYAASLALPAGARLALPVPALLKPLPLWTGKQLLGSLLALLAAGRPALSTACVGKVPAEYWGEGSGEETLVIHRGDVIQGVIDKAAFTKYGLVHSVAELYGNVDAGRLLAALSRMLTAYLADHGFTCGLDDMALTPAAERQRMAELGGADAASANAAEAFAFAGALQQPAHAQPRQPAEVRAVLVSRLRERKDAEAGLDGMSTGCAATLRLLTLLARASHALRARVVADPSTRSPPRPSRARCQQARRVPHTTLRCSPALSLGCE